MNTSTLVLLFWGERGDRKFESRNRKNKRSPFVDYSDESDEEDERAKRTRGGATRSGCAPTKGAPRSAAAPDEAAWVNPSLADATGLEDVNTGRLVEFMLSDCDWYLTNGEQKVQLLRNEGGTNNQNAVWTWFGDGKHEYCYRSTPDIKDVPGFRVPADIGALTGEGWQLMHEVKADPTDLVLAEKVRAGETWVNYGLFQSADLEALMQRSSDLGSLMSRNKGTNHTFGKKGIYKLYVESTELLTRGARWTHDYEKSKLLGTITMHTDKEQSAAIGCSDEFGQSFSTIRVTASQAAYKGEPGGVVFDPNIPAVRPLLHGSAVAITFDLGFQIEKIRNVWPADDCLVCCSAPPFKIPAGLQPFASCGHQDVCEECLLAMHERRQANCPQCRIVSFGGDDFMNLMRHMAQKKKIDDETDALRQQMEKINRQLQKKKTEQDAMTRLSTPNILQITSLGVSLEVSRKALEENDQDLERATQWALEKTAEEARLAQEAREKALSAVQSQLHDFGASGVPWKMKVTVVQNGSQIAPTCTTGDSRTYAVRTELNCRVYVHNCCGDDVLTFRGRYTDLEKDETELCSILTVQPWNNLLNPPHDTELWFPTKCDPGATLGDEFVLLDAKTGRDVLSIRLVPYDEP
jgi:hypothetical protein